jgi:large subunit ribosomal protein L31
MKKDIHPKFGMTTISCACGNVMHVGSTGKSMNINVCSACHPFYTGKSSMVDTEGRVEQFNRRYRQTAKA